MEILSKKFNFTTDYREVSDALTVGYVKIIKHISYFLKTMYLYIHIFHNAIRHNRFRHFLKF